MNFWANKLNGVKSQQASPVQSRELYPTFAPYTPPQPQPQAVSPAYTPGVRLIQGSTCPGCGTSNYRPLINNAAVACPICGYHPLFEQSGYGAPSLGTSKDATPARQDTSNYQSMQTAIAELNAGRGQRI